MRVSRCPILRLLRGGSPATLVGVVHAQPCNWVSTDSGGRPDKLLPGARRSSTEASEGDWPFPFWGASRLRSVMFGGCRPCWSLRVPANSGDGKRRPGQARARSGHISSSKRAKATHNQPVDTVAFYFHQLAPLP
ncbi:hypothetical protein B0J13DRAFT_551500 [Dactylonectria estremocensis]|uniref:Uncharacterized protein n=1 Tax=Dactylonectria estremocensis TaxID=1079267 RepID=A0A9P9F1I1_9HYPO|nr:hypothetical protein B0J13DRAFT_551500 [Dactylonectria estremocensis]